MLSLQPLWTVHKSGLTTTSGFHLLPGVCDLSLRQLVYQDAAELGKTAAAVWSREPHLHWSSQLFAQVTLTLPGPHWQGQLPPACSCFP